MKTPSVVNLRLLVAHLLEALEMMVWKDADSGYLQGQRVQADNMQ